MRFAIVLLLAAGCSSFQVAHRDSLRTVAANDFSCPREQVTASETPEGLWTAEGCGRVGSYKLLNPACIVERDCTWEARNGAPPAAAPPRAPAPPPPAETPQAPPAEPPK